MKLTFENIVRNCKKHGEDNDCSGCPFIATNGKFWINIDGERVYCYWDLSPEIWNLDYVKRCLLKED